MNETIYNLVPEVVVERPKPPMYRSKHDPKAPLAGSTFGIQGTTQVCLTLPVLDRIPLLYTTTTVEIFIRMLLLF